MEVISGGYNIPSLSAICHEYCNGHKGEHLEILDGEDVHVGLYKKDEESIRVAIWRTMRHLANKLKPITSKMIGVDLGCEIGGSARYLASVYGCRIATVNMSEVENRRHQAINNLLGIPRDQIEILETSITNIPKPNDSFDFALSQDRMMYADDCQQIFDEVHRVLKPGSKFVCTELMQSDDASSEAMQPIYDRIKRKFLTPELCREMAQKAGFQILEYEDCTDHLANHYQHLLMETDRKIEKLSADTHKTHLEQMRKGLQLLIEGGKNGHLEWGIFVLQKLG